MIEGRTPSQAIKFIADTEGVLKRIAEKALNEMEANKMIQYSSKGRTRTIEIDNII